MVRLEDRLGDARSIEAAQAPPWERRYTRRSARARTFAPTRASVEAVAGEQSDPDERLVPVADGRDRPAVLDRAFRMSRTSRRFADIVSSARVARTCDLGGFTEVRMDGHDRPSDEGRPARVEASYRLTRTRQDPGERGRVRQVLMRVLVPAAVLIVPAGAASAAANPTQASVADVVQALKIAALAADYEVVVDTSGFTQDLGPSAKAKLAPAGPIPALRPIDHVSLLTFDATPSDAHLPARLQ